MQRSFLTLMYTILFFPLGYYMVSIGIASYVYIGTRDIASIFCGIAGLLAILLLYRKCLFPYRITRVEKTTVTAIPAFFVFSFALLHTTAVYILVSTLLAIVTLPLPHYSVLYPVVFGAIVSTYLGIQSIITTADCLPDEQIFTQDHDTITKNNKLIFKSMLLSSVFGVVGLLLTLVLMFW